MAQTLSLTYENNFHDWINQHITLLRTGRFAEIDVEHLVEELEGMANRDRNELVSHLVILIAHLLKWQFQLQQLTERWKEFRGGSWQSSIIEQRYRINEQLENLPSLQNYLNEAIVKAYPKAVILAVDETNLPKRTFPSACPYSFEQLLNKNFYPNSDNATNQS